MPSAHKHGSAQPRLGIKKLAREGQVVILFALTSIVLLGGVGLSVDVGFLIAERRQLQAAADAAAMAAAQSGLDNNLGQMQSAGKLYGAENAGVSQDNVIVTVDADGPPDDEAERYVEVTITKDVQKFFLEAVYKGRWAASATAMAAVEPIEANYALITLDQDATPGIYMNGTTSIEITGNQGSAVSNSTIRGSNNTDFMVDGAIHAFGDITGGGHWEDTAPLGVRANRNRIVPDPIAEIGLLAPTRPAVSRDQQYVDECLKSSSCQLEPGLYDGITIAMENKDKINLTPGLYYFDGDSRFDLNNKSELAGDGVLLYFTGSSRLNPKNGNITLKSATLASEEEEAVDHDDMVVWVDNCTDVSLQGEGDMYFEGIFYAPCSHSWMHGNTKETIRGQLVLGSLDVRGGDELTIAYEERVETWQPSVFLVR